MPEPLSPRDRLLAYRRSQPRPPELERRTVRVNKLDLAVWLSPPVEGAVPLCCVNGGLLYGHDLLWPSLAALAQKRQLVLFDQRGRGESQAPPQPLAARIEDDAADVAALRFALGFRQWDLLGHSWGGGIAMLAASRDRAGTRRLVTVNAVGPTSSWFGPLHANALPRLRDYERELVERVHRDEELHRADPELHSEYSRAVYRAWFADPELGRMYAAPPKTISLTGTSVAARLRREGYDWSDRIRALAAPTLVMHGEQDSLPILVAEELLSLLPKASFVPLPGAGHMPFWEAPEPFFTAAEHFLSAPDPFDPHALNVPPPP